MRFLTPLIFMLFLGFTANAQEVPDRYVRISTSMGDCVVKLYKETPLHANNFIKLVKAGFYNGTLFHRVVKNFMIQGGDPTSKNAAEDATIGGGRLKYTIPAEMRDSLFHKKGALAAGRNDDPEKASNACQFYLVSGEVFTDSMLDRVEEQKEGYKIPAWQRKVYKTIGGAPFLDHDFTVFGEVVKGLELIDAIAKVRTNIEERPKKDIKMEVTVLTPEEVAALLNN